MTDLVERLDRLLAGFSGENELSVGPHMLAQGVKEARDHITALQARVEELELQKAYLEAGLEAYQARVEKLEGLVNDAYQEGFAAGGWWQTTDGRSPDCWWTSQTRAALAGDYCGIVEVNEEDFKAEGEKG